MGQFCENIACVLIHFVHQIVYYQKNSVPPVESIHVRQCFVKLDLRKFYKLRLEFPVTVQNLFVRRVY
jgi:hypothetical protein